MYNLNDYLRSGFTYVNNSIRPGHKRLDTLMIYATTRCQSACKHCNIWKKPQEHLTLADIKRLMTAKCVTKNTNIGLEGGEFVLHPQADEIMEWFMEHHPKYTLLSNCLATRKTIESVRKYRPARLYVSLDGDRKAYKRMRGCDGYDKVIRVVEEVKDDIPVSLMFCLSPWNSFKDMEHVIEVSNRYGVDIRIGVYGTMAFFDTAVYMLDTGTEGYKDCIPECVHNTEENFDFIALYDEWKNGRLKLPCHSIHSMLAVHSDGNVPICQNLDISLGNIHEKTLDEIFNSEKAREIQCRYSRKCNGCWINFHRKYDIILLRNLERLMPRKIIEAFFGEYHWSENGKETYRQYIKRTARRNT